MRVIHPNFDIKHFMSKIDVKDFDECHPWKGAPRGKNGHGGYCITGRWGAPGAKYRSAHSVMLELKLGRPLRSGYVACHECDNPSCCNPNHLWEGTIAENNRDSMRKGRNRKGTKCTPEQRARISAGYSKRKQYKCGECPKITEGSGMSSHHRSTKHHGRVEVNSDSS